MRYVEKNNVSTLIDKRNRRDIKSRLASIIKDITRSVMMSVMLCDKRMAMSLYKRRQQSRLNFTRIFTWAQYFIEHLMLGHVLSLSGEAAIYESKYALKISFSYRPVPWIRNSLRLVPCLEYLTRYLSVAFLLFPFFLSLSFAFFQFSIFSIFSILQEKPGFVALVSSFNERCLSVC